MPDCTIPWLRRLCCPCYQHTQLKSSVTRIVSELKFFHRTFIQWLWLQAEYAILISVVGSVAVYSNLFMSFCSVIFGIIVPSASFDLTSVPESSQMRRTPWQPIAVCAVAAASQCSHFSQCFVVKFCTNHFQFLHLKILIFVCYILWRISPKLCEFSTQL